jgi:hypothetical protein
VRHPTRAQGPKRATTCRFSVMAMSHVVPEGVVQSVHPRKVAPSPGCAVNVAVLPGSKYSLQIVGQSTKVLVGEYGQEMCPEP